MQINVTNCDMVNMMIVIVIVIEGNKSILQQNDIGCDACGIFECAMANSTAVTDDGL